MHDIWTALSGLQKAIRRGIDRDAAGWALHLARTGRGSALWARLFVITSEDVGPAEPYMPAQIWALHGMWAQANKQDAKELAVVHAAVLLARAKKTRVVDDLKAVAKPPNPIPDYVFDRHTSRGARMGRGWDHFFQVASHLENEVATDENTRYREEAEQELRRMGTAKKNENGKLF